MTKTKRLKILGQIYARVPNANCKGLCASACSTIPAQPLEVERLEQAAGRALVTTPFELGSTSAIMLGTEVGAPCPLLVLDRCSAYDARPLICRLYGVADGLRCRHGCEPDAALTTEQSAALIHEVQEIAR